VSGNIVSWRSKKQAVVSRSTTEAEHRAMALAFCEKMWLKGLLKELRVLKNETMLLHCDNVATINIANNPV
jgi:lactam utilization protein B